MRTMCSTGCNRKLQHKEVLQGNQMYLLSASKMENELLTAAIHIKASLLLLMRGCEVNNWIEGSHLVRNQAKLCR
jgi:hypothetical protein